MEFLAAHEFSVVLSFDGLAQDVSRKKGSFDVLASVIRRISAEPRISLETNSVFSSETVGYLSESVELLVRLGVPRLDVNFAHKPHWTSASLRRLEDEIARVSDFFLSRYEHLRDVPWIDFCEEPPKMIYGCPAGSDRMALSAQGMLWGCVIFPHCRSAESGSEVWREFCFGDIDSFMKDPQHTYAEKIGLYAELRMDRFSTPERACLMCDELADCWLCPLAAGLSTGEIGKISPESCQRARIMRNGKRRFLDEFGRRARRATARSSG